ncbi:hypothetical protein LR69_00172 [Geobacillus sp. BCO2]|nr:hypothetical protein LR69_00172 [Geobacillus sp. BCO2]
MKTRTVFAGILFIGLGLYFLAGQLESPLFHFFQGWPALLAICGAALLGQAHAAREYAYLFPGFLLLGFGVELLLASAFSAWPRGVNMFFSSSRSLFSPAAANKKAGPALACFFASRCRADVFRARPAILSPRPSRTFLCLEVLAARTHRHRRLSIMD